jgi:hypothetical protein
MSKKRKKLVANLIDESFLWLFIYETRLNIFSYEIKFEIDTMQKYTSWVFYNCKWLPGGYRVQ